MSVTVDDQVLPARQLGLHTIGEVLTHLQQSNRLVVQLLVDGQPPDWEQLAAVRQSSLDDHTLVIETADSHALALEVLDELDAQLVEADQLKAEAAELLQKNESLSAMQKLAGCFSRWQGVHESLLKIAQLLSVDLEGLHVGDRTLDELFSAFGEQVKSIRSALESRDFVTLSDILLYETADTSAEWRQAIAAVRDLASGL